MSEQEFDPNTYFEQTVTDFVAKASNGEMSKVQVFGGFLKILNIAGNISRIQSDTQIPQDQKDAVTALIILDGIAGLPIPTDIPATYESYYNAINNAPDNFGGGTKEEFFQELNEMNEDLFPLDANGEIGTWNSGNGATPTSQLPESGAQPDSRPSAPFVPEEVVPSFDDAVDAGSPLVLDLDGDGIELAALNGPGSVYWDIDVDGFGEASGWIAGGDGLLAIDLDGNGVINDHSELFGDQTGSPNGFAALAAYDSNSDGQITSFDTEFGDLRVWIDTNADGYSQADELHTLNDLGISSIDLGYSDVSYWVSGNEIKQESTFTINGQTQTIVDAWFTYDNVNSVYVEDFTIDTRTLSLPTLRGYGTLPDLHIAMSQDETLLTMVQDLADADVNTVFSSAFDWQGRMEDILYRWAGVDSVDPASRGPNIDARKLEFLEELVGEDWLHSSADSNPNTGPALLLEKAYQEAFANFAMQTLVQTGNGAIFSDAATYDAYTGEVDGAETVNRFWFLDEHHDVLADSTDTVDYYYYRAGSGIDVITDRGGAADRLVFGEGIAVDDIRLWNTGRDLEIHIGSDKITIDDQFRSSYDKEIETAVFADGSTLDLLHNLTFTGTSAGESVYGRTNQNDTIIGSGGDDTLYGETGDDAYIYNLGDGSDTIIDGGGAADRLVFGEGITADDIRLWKAGRDLEIHVGSDKIKIDDQFRSSYDKEIETAVFADGSTLDLLHDLTFTGTTADEYVYGRAGENDTIVGSGGDDTLYGDTGDDDYIYSLGDGSDTILDYGGAADRLVFGAGIAADDVRLWNTGRDLEIHIGSDKITIDDQFRSSYDKEIETAVFADGSTLDLLHDLTFTGTSAGEDVYGTSDGDVLYGLGGSDNLYGQAGADTFAYVSEDLDGSSDTIRDFSLSDGDKLDVSDLLEGYDPIADAITDFIHITSSGSHSYLRVDADGGANNFIQIAKLNYATGLGDEEALETNGTLITV